MIKINKKLLYAGVALLLAALACNMPRPPAATQTPPPSSATPTRAVAPTLPPTATDPMVMPTIALAPICDPEQSADAGGQCNMPLAEQTSTFCQNKKPYNLLLVNAGATFETKTERFSCFPNGMKNGRQIVACTGLMAAQFEVTVCDPSCVVPTKQATTTACPAEYNYNYYLGCCTQAFQSVQPNCMTLKLETIRCQVNCREFTRASTCNKNSVACKWDPLKKVCNNR